MGWTAVGLVEEIFNNGNDVVSGLPQQLNGGQWEVFVSEKTYCCLLAGNGRFVPAGGVAEGVT